MKRKGLGLSTARVRVVVPGSDLTSWCAYCGVEQATTADHVVPLKASWWGSTRQVVPACEWCNTKLCDQLFGSLYEKQMHIYELRRRTGRPSEHPSRISVQRGPSR